LFGASWRASGSGFRMKNVLVIPAIAALVAACGSIPELPPGADPNATRIINFGISQMSVETPNPNAIRFVCVNHEPTGSGNSWVANCEAIALAVLKQERAAGRLGFEPRQYPLVGEHTAFVPPEVVSGFFMPGRMWRLFVEFDRDTGRLLDASPTIPRQNGNRVR
jgi:hypothetical protein